MKRLGAFVLATTLTAGSAAADDRLELTRERASALGAERGPPAREAAAPIAAADAMHEDSDSPLPYSPKLSAFAGARKGGFGSGFEVGGSLQQELSLHGLGGRRHDVADVTARATRDELSRARLEGAGFAALAWADLVEAQELARVREATRIDADEIARVARARTDRGVALPSEAALASAEVGSAELGERDAEGRVYEARAALAFAIGDPPGTMLVAAGNLTAIGPPADRRPEGPHPADVAARSQVDLARADARLARAQSAPSWAVGVNVAREGTGERFLTGTLTLPLPFFDPSTFEAARQRVNVEAAMGRTASVSAARARDVALATHERLHTREVRETLITKLLAPLRESVRLARASYQAGTQDVTGFLLLRQRLVVAEEQGAHAAADVLRADVRYEVTVGTLLAETGRR